MFNIVLKKQNIIQYSFFVIFIILLYPILVFDSLNKSNPLNFMIYVIAFLIFLYSVYSIKEKNVNSYNIFLFGFFIALFLNTFNMSSKQLEKDLNDFYLFLVGPLVVFIILYFFENIRFNKIVIKTYIKLDTNTFYISIIFLYITLKLYIGLSVGFRIFEYGDISQIQSGDKFKIPGISGLAATFQWMLLIFAPYVKRKYIFIGIVSIIIFSGFLDVKRGDLVRVFIFFIIYWYFLNFKMNKIDSKKIFLIGISLLLFIYLFSLYGEYRLLERGGYEGIIKDYLGSRVDSVLVSWIYSYLALNFDVLKLYFDFTPQYELSHFYSFFMSDTDSIAVGVNKSISGFNATTFIQPYFLDFGYFYWLEVILVFLILGALILFVKKINFIGMYIFLLMLLFLMLFGDYFTTRTILVTIITSLLIYPFLRIRKKIELDL
jgi:oligosaccharide repeat unit polymerase